jgi:hypothetical protein
MVSRGAAIMSYFYTSRGSTARDADMHLLYDGSSGIYIPKMFATLFSRSHVSGVSDEDYAILEAGPEHDLYWDAWADVLDRARLTINGKEYFMYQDGDCWAIEKGAEWNEDSNVSGKNWIVEGEPS